MFEIWGGGEETEAQVYWTLKLQKNIPRCAQKTESNNQNHQFTILKYVYFNHKKLLN